MRSVRFTAAITGCAVAALVLSACGSKGSSGSPSSTPPPAGGNSVASSTGGSSGGGASSATTAAALKACMVLDTGGIDDHSFNETSYAGMTKAHKSNPNIAISYIPSNSGNDYTPNLNTEIGKGCDPVIGVGGLMATNVKKVAEANPKTHFAEVDAPSSGSNVYGMQFNTAQGAFLGGILAAGMSKTGVVGTWGGAKIGPVTIYMDGFWEGVQYYNKQNNKNVKVLGWDENKQSSGTFVPGNNPFGDPNDGKSISQTMINQGADILLPVAGGSGIGAANAAKASNGKVKVIWVDTDGCKSLKKYCKYFLSSVVKGLSQAVSSYLDKASNGSFPTGNYIGTLANKGTGLAPYHDFEGKIPQPLTAKINKAKADIISGKIKITSPAQPKT